MINADAMRSEARSAPADADTPRSAVVGVLAAPGRRRQARCSCGWDGPRRWLLPKAAAVDALTHARTQGCVPAYPLVQAADEPATWRPDDGVL
ncbi:hypothetical protein QN239_32915 [Mycolicibacterium sp. Y3]